MLSKKDMWDVLKEYPAARVRLEAIAVKRLEKYKRTPLEKGGSSLFYPSSRALPNIYKQYLCRSNVFRSNVPG